MLVIIDAGLGNIASVLNMVRKVGGSAMISSQKEDIASASKLILPGVGAFKHGIEQLQRLNHFSAILETAERGVPVLGLCLGMQLLGKSSEEGNISGLGLIDAEFRRFAFDDKSSLRVPHVGWNHIKVSKQNRLVPKDDSEQRFYFTHSYHAVCANDADILSTTEYGYTFTSAYSHKNIYGVQFHPEKSHKFGMALIKNFLEI